MHLTDVTTGPAASAAGSTVRETVRRVAAAVFLSCVTVVRDGLKTKTMQATETIVAYAMAFHDIIFDETQLPPFLQRTLQLSIQWKKRHHPIVIIFQSKVVQRN